MSNKPENFNIDFIPEINADFEKVQEKYVRRGPSPRYKVSVTPVKILTRCKGGTPCYKTYYVGAVKRDLYKKVAKHQLLTGVRNPKYLLYWNETAPRFKQYKVRGFARKYLGSTFTKEFAHLSGFVWKQTNYLAKFGVSSYSEVVSSKFTNDGAHIVKLKDGSAVKSRLLLSRDGKLRLITDMNLVAANGNIRHRAEIGGRINLVRDSNGVTRRVLRINKLDGYDAEALASFMDYAQSKFARVHADISNLNNKQIAMLLLNGFGENVKVTNELKQKILNMVKNAPERIRNWISSANSIQDIVNALVKFGVVNENDDRLQEIVNHIKNQNIRELVFNSVSNGVHNTKSQNTLHAFQLQISADNDYHKGFRKYRKLIGGE